MKRTLPIFRRTALLALSGWVLACGPLVMIPGGELSGELRPTPTDWSFTDEVDVVQLETRPDDPYSVNVWGVGMGAHFYVISGDAEKSAWAQNILADPRVRLRVGDDLYAQRAERVEDDAEIERLIVGLKKKYDFEPEEGQRETAAVFRLVARR